MKKLLYLVLVSLFSMYLLNACTMLEKNPFTKTFANIFKKAEEKNILPGDRMQQALVIGNAEYQRNSLTHPANNANEMADILKEQGFNVFLYTNLDRKQMEKVISEFKNRLSAYQKSVGLFYFSGHGLQMKGKNYLIPVNNNEIKFEDEVPWKAIEVDKLLIQMQQRTKNGLNIILLDTCQDHLYTSRPTRGDGKDGLASIVPPEGFVIGYATAPGRTASDSEDSECHGLFTKHLLKAIQPKKRIDDVLIQVHNAVKKESNGKQIPWYSSAMTKPFCFSGCP